MKATNKHHNKGQVTRTKTKLNASSRKMFVLLQSLIFIFIPPCRSEKVIRDTPGRASWYVGLGRGGGFADKIAVARPSRENLLIRKNDALHSTEYS